MALLITAGYVAALDYGAPGVTRSAQILETWASLGAYASDILAATNEANFKLITNLEAGTDFLAPTGDGSGILYVPTIVISDADADPTVDDDTDGSPTAATPNLSGYNKGDIYVNGTASPAKYFVCVNNADGAADWDQLNPTQVTIASNGFLARTGAGTAAAVPMTQCIYIEDPDANDDLLSIFRNCSASDYTLTEIWAESDQTVTFNLQVDDGSPADVNGADLAPAAGQAEDTSLEGDATLAVDEELDLKITSVANTPTWVSICFSYVVAATP